MVRKALAAAGIALMCAGAPARDSAPEGLNIRIVGTASFQGKNTALIEDTNTHSDSFYKTGDPIYGYKITVIAPDGISLEKSGRKYFVAFQQTSLKARADEKDQKVVVANNYLPAQTRATVPNFYLDVPRGTQWDLWTANARETAPAPASVVAEVGGRFVMPLASYKRLSSGLGYRVHPIGGGTKIHKGIDLAAKSGTKIFAADGGTVIFRGRKGGYGNCIIIDHHNGYTTTYGHCSKLVADTGDNVRRGDFIAAVGSTGAATGPHLHFEVRLRDVPIDPVQFFRGIL